MKTILAATDGSTYADAAVSASGKLADAYDADVFLLHVVADIIGDGIPRHLKARLDATNEQIGDVLIAVGEDILQRAEGLARDNGASNVTTAMPKGQPADMILRYGDERNTDLIVMGSRGLGKLTGLLLGSVSHRVHLLAPCDCLVVR